MDVAIARNDRGQVNSESAGLLNAAGYNQHFKSPRLQAVDRIDLAVNDRLRERHECAQAYADKVMAALSDPLGELRISDASIVEFAAALKVGLGKAGYLTQEIEDVLRKAARQATDRLRKMGQTSNLELLKFAFSSGPIEQVLGAAAIGREPEPDPEGEGTDEWARLSEDFGSAFPEGAQLAEGGMREEEPRSEGAD